MRRILYYVCLFWFALLEVKAFKTDHNFLLHRLKRAVNSKYQNTSIYNTHPNWYNTKLPILNGTRSEWSNPGGHYNQRNIHNSNNRTYDGDRRPQNEYGYNINPNGFNSPPPPWTGSGPQRNNPDGHYYAGNNPREVGWNPQNTSRFNADPNRYNSKPAVYYNGTGPQLINPAPQWQRTGENYIQSNLNYPNRPTQISEGPQSTSGYNIYPNGYNTKPAGWNNSGPQMHNLGKQYYAAPNDLMLQRFKRSVNNRHYNVPWYNTDPNWHKNKGPAWNGTRPHWNNSNSNYYQGNVANLNHNGNGSFGRRWIRAIHHSGHHNISWYNNEPAWNGSYPQWNKPGGHYYYWHVNEQNNATNSMRPCHEEPPRHHHRHHHNHEPYPVPPPNFGQPPPPNNGPPLQSWPKHHFHRDWRPKSNPPPGFNNTIPEGNGTAINTTDPWVPDNGTDFNSTVNNGTYPWVPDNDNDLNGTVTNGTNHWLPETEVGSNGTVVNPGLNGTNINGTFPWGPEIPDMNGYDEDGATPVPE